MGKGKITTQSRLRKHLDVRQNRRRDNVDFKTRQQVKKIETKKTIITFKQENKQAKKKSGRHDRLGNRRT